MRCYGYSRATRFMILLLQTLLNSRESKYCFSTHGAGNVRTSNLKVAGAGSLSLALALGLWGSPFGLISTGGSRLLLGSLRLKLLMLLLQLLMTGMNKVTVISIIATTIFGEAGT